MSVRVIGGTGCIGSGSIHGNYADERRARAQEKTTSTTRQGWRLNSFFNTYTIGGDVEIGPGELQVQRKRVGWSSNEAGRVAVKRAYPHLRGGPRQRFDTVSQQRATGRALLLPGRG